MNEQTESTSESPDQTAKQRPETAGETLIRLARGLANLQILIAVAVFCAIGVALVYWFFDGSAASVWHYLGREIGKALIVAVFVSTGVQALLARQTRALARIRAATLEEERKTREESLRASLDSLETNLRGLTRELADKVSSIEALRDSHVAKFYPNRERASEDIRQAVLGRSATEVQIIGISLNDFLQPSQKPLNRAWIELRNRVAAQQSNGTDRLSIRLLLLDPYCGGAMLRSSAESAKGQARRLEKDVDQAIDLLSNLITEGSTEREAVKLEVRFYRTVPTLFLVRTPVVSFIQQYYLRDTHDPPVNVPVLRVDSGKEEGVDSMHDELNYHFNWLWEHASIGLEDIRKHCYGPDRAIRRACIENAYYERSESRGRIVSLLEGESNAKVWIKGVSLRSFFQLDNPLYRTLRRQMLDRVLDVRLLLIDPLSEQAVLRAYREYLIGNSPMPLSEFKESFHSRQRLVTDTENTLRQVEALRTEIDAKKSKSTLHVRLYQAAPAAFVFLTENSVIVEQYHYGRQKSADDDRATLEGEVPLFEYTNPKRRADLEFESEKNPYEIMMDHFDFVFQSASIEPPATG